MLLTEHHGKSPFRDVHVSMPSGAPTSNIAELSQLNQRFIVAAKAQVTSAGRGTAGSIRRCGPRDEVYNAFSENMEMAFDDTKPIGVHVARGLTGLSAAAREAMNSAAPAAVNDSRF